WEPGRRSRAGASPAWTASPKTNTWRPAVVMKEPRPLRVEAISTAGASSPPERSPRCLAVPTVRTVPSELRIQAPVPSGVTAMSTTVPSPAVEVAAVVEVVVGSGRVVDVVVVVGSGPVVPVVVVVVAGPLRMVVVVVGGRRRDAASNCSSAVVVVAVGTVASTGGVTAGTWRAGSAGRLSVETSTG